MTVTAGTRLGTYEVIAPLGAGGMGEVYRAKDTKLGRDVALKILPATFTNDPDRVARFRREAQVLASLNHLHIAQIHGLDEFDGKQFLVLELVDGESLDKRIARGPIPVDEALDIAKQIAEALEAAHEKGIIHRDLKPANLALTTDGNVKVLDFGLAKATEPASGTSLDVTNSPTITTPAMMTAVGVILGTAAYMSPEQATGGVADKRSDVWAFGCVLYEILVGRRVFEGEDVGDTLAAILRDEPDWTALPGEIAPWVTLLLHGCLEKDRRRRISHVSTIRFVLENGETIGARITPNAPTEGEERGASTERSAWRRWRIRASVAGLVIGAAAIGAAVAWRTRPEVPAPMVTRFPIALGQGQQFTNTGDLVLALSPDGSKIVYAANRQLYVRSMSDLEARPIRGTDVNPRHPMFAPDGSFVAYFSPAEGALKRIALSGGSPVTVALANESANAPLGGSWTNDRIVFGQLGGPNHGIVSVPAAGGKLQVVVKIKPDEVADGPQLLPDGEHILFTLARSTTADRWETSKILVQSLTTGDRKVLVDGGSDGRYLKTGHLVYALGGVIYAVRFDPKQLQLLGAPVAVLEGVRRAFGSSVWTGTAQWSVADNGTVAFIPGAVSAAVQKFALMLVDRNGGAESLTLPPAAYGHPRVSPDGNRLAYQTDDGREATVWVYDLSGSSAARRLTLRGNNRWPVWSANGSQIAFQSDREGDLGIFVQQADGTGTAQRLTTPETGVAHVPESWSPDGKRLLFSASKESTFVSMILSLDDGKTSEFGDVRSRISIGAVFSPDGEWIGYAARGTVAVSQIYVQPFPPTGAVYQLTKSTDSIPSHPFWSRDGRELLFLPGAGQWRDESDNEASVRV
jgi:serine/threonine-protein kinase